MILYFIIFYFYLVIRAGGSGGLRWDMDRRSSSSSSRRSKLVLLVLVYRLVATWPCCPRAGPWAISCWPDLRLHNNVATATSDSSSLMASLHNPNTRHRHPTEETEKSWKKRKNKKKGERKKAFVIVSLSRLRAYTEPAVPSLSPDKTETRAGFFVVPLAVTRLTEFWRPDDIDFCLVWVGHLFSRYYFVLFCVFEVFQFVLDVGPIHPNGAKG